MSNKESEFSGMPAPGGVSRLTHDAVICTVSEQLEASGYTIEHDTARPEKFFIVTPTGKRFGFKVDPFCESRDVMVRDIMARLKIIAAAEGLDPPDVAKAKTKPPGVASDVLPSGSEKLADEPRPTFYTHGVREPVLVMSFAAAVQGEYILLEEDDMSTVREIFMHNRAPRGLWLIPVQP